MNRTALVTFGLTATVVAATAATGPALAQSSAKTVTQHFTAENSSAPLILSRTAYVLTDNDVRKGKTIGRDVLSCTDAGTGTSHCHVAFAQKGGELYARFMLRDSTGALKGTVTGGTGKFSRVKGTLAGQAVSRTDVNITLHFKK